MNWFNNLPSPVRHAVITLAASELVLVANAFVGVTSLNDVKVAAGGVMVAAIACAARWLQQAMSGVK